MSRKQFDFLASDALAFADALRYGLRLPMDDLENQIRQEEASGHLGPAGLQGLQFALVRLRTGASPAVVRFYREVPDGEINPAAPSEVTRA